MDISPILQSIAASSPIALAVFGVLGTLVVIGQAVVVFTPSKSDDAVWEKIKAVPLIGPLISALTGFAYFQKK